MFTLKLFRMNICVLVTWSYDDETEMRLSFDVLFYTDYLTQQSSSIWCLIDIELVDHLLRTTSSSDMPFACSVSVDLKWDHLEVLTTSPSVYA